MYQALYRKWRPKTFDDVTGQEHVTKTLKNQVAQGRLSHAYLFTGTRGTGKTTCAKILAKAVNCEHPVDGNPCNECSTCKGIDNGSILEVLELDAASNNGVEQIRSLRDEAIYSPAYCSKRVYIVDEVHMLSTAAFNALLKILEEPPEHLMFILATTELHKVPATILSRCQRFSFKRLLPQQIQDRLLYVSQQESLGLTEEGASLLSRLAEGSMRDGLSLLDQCTGLGNTIDAPLILNVLGLAGNLDTARLMEAVGRRDTPKALEILTELYEGGREMGALLGALSGLARDILILKTVPSSASRLLTGGYEENTLHQLAAYFTPARLIQMVTLLQHTMDGFSKSSNRRTDGELCIIRLCDETLSDDMTGVLARLSRLEEMAEQGVWKEPPAKKENDTASEGKQNKEEDEDLPPWEEGPSSQKEKQPIASVVSEVVNTVPKKTKDKENEGHVEKGKGEPDNTSPKEAGKAQAMESEEIWNAISGTMRKAVLMPAFAVLSNRTMTELVLQNQILTVYTDTELTRSIVGTQEVSKALAAACSDRFAGPISVRWKLKSEREKEESPVQKGLVENDRAEKRTKDALDELVHLCQGLDPVILD